MTAATIQSAIDFGNSIAAQQLGILYQQYRPQGTGNPLSQANLIGTLPALFTQDTAFTKLPKTKSDEYIGYFDGSQTQPGDYLTAGDRTFFVATQQPFLPYLVINCQRIVNIYQAAANTAVGLSGYGGNTAATETAVITGWPASCGAGPRGEKGDVTLPDDVKNPWWVFRLPTIAGITMNTDYIITDDLGRRYSVSSAELSEFGWKLTARQNVS